MKLYDALVDKAESLALVGLGYVGMPIAVAFAKKGLKVIGFDLNKEKGITLIIVTHDEELAAKCKRQIRIADGEIVEDAKTKKGAKK